MAAPAAVMSETRSTKGAATRDQILNVAARLIHVQGYQSTSLDDVLRESGVGKGNFYYYFKSKEDLGYAIIDRITQAFVERSLGPAFADTDADPVSQIHAFFDRWLVRLPLPLTAAVPGGFTTHDFTIDPQAGTVGCPAGDQARSWFRRHYLQFLARAKRRATDQ